MRARATCSFVRPGHAQEGWGCGGLGFCPASSCLDSRSEARAKYVIILQSNHYYWSYLIESPFQWFHYCLAPLLHIHRRQYDVKRKNPPTISPNHPILHSARLDWMSPLLEKKRPPWNSSVIILFYSMVVCYVLRYYSSRSPVLVSNDFNFSLGKATRWSGEKKREKVDEWNFEKDYSSQ